MGVQQANEYIQNLILVGDIKEEHYSGSGLEARAACNSPEAFAIIQSLEKLGKSSEEKILVEWEEPKSNGRKWFIKKYAHDMSHQDMLSRLAWITSEEYGDDINLWKKWVEFRKENGFMGTR